MEVKRAKVIMLPTNNGVILKGIKNKGLSAPIILSNESNEEWDKFGTPQHLYFTTDEDIKSGDWKLINTDTDKLSTVVQHEKGINYYKQSKIIATTDKRIKNQMLLDGFDRIYPQPSKSFIEKYCKLGGIDEVMVELTEWGVGFGHDKNGIELPLRLKVNSHNEIAIHTIKDNWSRDEVNHILRDFSNVMGLDSSYVRSYIKENI